MQEESNVPAYPQSALDQQNTLPCHGNPAHLYRCIYMGINARLQLCFSVICHTSNLVQCQQLQLYLSVAYIQHVCHKAIKFACSMTGKYDDQLLQA